MKTASSPPASRPDQARIKLTSRARSSSRSILLVDDEEYMLSLLKEIVQMLGHRAVTALSGAQALEKLTVSSIDLVITDLNMPGMSGLELMSRVKQTRPQVPVVLISGYGVEHAARTARKHHADGFIGKPFHLEDLRLCIEEHLK
jgi:CheY-like chemotaxis protein